MLPGFTAENSLRRSSRSYRTVMSAAAPAGAVVVPAYMPGTATQARCNDCTTGCAEQMAVCSALATALLAGCVFPPLCPGAAAAAGAALAACDVNLLTCMGRCAATKCCPKLCGVLDPFDPGSGCCDSNEQCVSESDPNARRGCCPAGQAVCGGKCCAPDERCCGTGCCPPNWHCIDNVCHEYPPLGPYTPTDPTVITPLPASGVCPSGTFRCRDKCCPSGMSCCGYGCEWGTCVN